MTKSYETPQIIELGTVSQLTEQRKVQAGNDGIVLVVPGPDIQLGNAS